MRIWQLQTGKELFRFQQGEPCRSVNLAVGESLMAYTTDAFMGTAPQIHIVKLELDDISKQSAKPVLTIDAPKGRITRAFWHDLNRVIVTSHDGGFMRKWDSEVRGGKECVPEGRMRASTAQCCHACLTNNMSTCLISWRQQGSCFSAKHAAH